MRGVMKQEFKQLRFWQLLSVAGFFINALSLIFMVQSPGQLGPDVLTVVSGIMFWAGLLLGIAGQVVLLRKTKGLPGKAHVGLIRIFTNRYGFIADVTLGVSLIGVFITLFAGNGMGIFMQIIWSLFIFSFSMHCVLNGRKFNYIYRLKNKRSVRNERRV